MLCELLLETVVLTYVFKSVNLSSDSRISMKERKKERKKVKLKKNKERNIILRFTLNLVQNCLFLSSDKYFINKIIHF